MVPPPTTHPSPLPHLRDGHCVQVVADHWQRTQVSAQALMGGLFPCADATGCPAGRVFRMGVIPSVGGANLELDLENFLKGSPNCGTAHSTLKHLYVRAPTACLRSQWTCRLAAANTSRGITTAAVFVFVSVIFIPRAGLSRFLAPSACIDHRIVVCGQVQRCLVMPRVSRGAGLRLPPDPLSPMHRMPYGVFLVFFPLGSRQRTLWFRHLRWKQCTATPTLVLFHRGRVCRPFATPLAPWDMA